MNQNISKDDISKEILKADIPKKTNKQEKLPYILVIKSNQDTNQGFSET